ncbi:hypothetical protein DK871_29405 [Pseudomonas sp. L13]|nr:hypothetical protein [Pseudomonas sp. L13]
MARALAPVTACQPPPISLTHHSQTVGAGLPAMTACQLTPISLASHDQPVGAGLLAKAAWQSTRWIVCISIPAVTAT